LTGLVTKILKFSLVDGPGNRTVIFLQGCNMVCLNCHNPHTINRCRHCGECVSLCPNKALALHGGEGEGAKGSGQEVIHLANRCRDCDLCVASCPHNSTPKARLMDVSEVLAIIKQTSPFIAGITVSGGECTTQAEFVRELFTQVKAETNLNTFIDSNGNTDPKAWDRLMPVTDGVMLDCKAWDPDTHRLLTGSDIQAIKTSIIHLVSLDKLYEVRHLVIPGFTDDETHLRSMVAFLAATNPQIRLVLQRFRNHGVRGPLAGHPSPSQELMLRFAQVAREARLREIRIR